MQLTVGSIFAIMPPPRPISPSPTNGTQKDARQTLPWTQGLIGEPTFGALANIFIFIFLNKRKVPGNPLESTQKVARIGFRPMPYCRVQYCTATMSNQKPKRSQTKKKKALQTNKNKSKTKKEAF